MATAPVLDVQNLKTHFFTRTGVVKAVDGVSFSLMPGETLGIVGESGSGKSMTALSLMRLVPQPAGRIVDGKILFQGEDLVEKTQSEMQDIRGRDICMILQDPMTSLNPVFSIGNQLTETVQQGERQSGSRLKARAIETQCYVLAANQCGWHDDKRRTWGHSMIVDPWGESLGMLHESPGVIVADVDLKELENLRKKMPLTRP